MSAEHLHHTQQFSQGYKVEGLDVARPRYHTTGHVLGNVALNELSFAYPHHTFRTISREEALLSEANKAAEAKKFEDDRAHVVDEAFKGQSTLATTINAAPEAPAIDLSVYVETNTGHTAQTDY